MNEGIRVNYYAIIPATVRYDEKLKANEKLMYGEITALSNKYGYCYANNKYFAELYDVTIHTVSQWISHLEKLGYIIVELIKSENKEIKERRIYISDIPYVPKNTYPYVLKSTETMYQKIQDNNINKNIDDLFYLIINERGKISKELYEELNRLELVYEQEIINVMQQENIQKIKEIIYTVFCIYESNYKYIVKRLNREILINIYYKCKEHNVKDFLNYYKQSIINQYIERI